MTNFCECFSFCLPDEHALFVHLGGRSFFYRERFCLPPLVPLANGFAASFGTLFSFFFLGNQIFQEYLFDKSLLSSFLLPKLSFFSERLECHWLGRLFFPRVVMFPASLFLNRPMCQTFNFPSLGLGCFFKCFFLKSFGQFICENPTFSRPLDLDPFLYSVPSCWKVSADGCSSPPLLISGPPSRPGLAILNNSYILFFFFFFLHNMLLLLV